MGKSTSALLVLVGIGACAGLFGVLTAWQALFVSLLSFACSDYDRALGIRARGDW